MSDFFVHPHGLCESTTIGPGTRIWAFAHVLPGAKIGANCNICDNVFIENNVIVGDDVTLKCGVQLWDGLRIGHRVFVGPNATFTNDRYPRSKQYPDEFAKTVICDDASIGANATILPGLHIGRNAMIGAGAVVTKDVPPHAVIVGNPGVIVGYQTNSQKRAEPSDLRPPKIPGSKIELGVGACTLWRLPQFSDLRGELAAMEFTRDVPFVPTRTFIVYGVPTAKVRGEHAHRRCHQFLIATHGSLSVVLDDGHRREEVQLSDPSLGLHILPGVWGIQYKFLPETALLVFASHPYEPGDYIRDYSEFLMSLTSNE